MGSKGNEGLEAWMEARVDEDGEAEQEPESEPEAKPAETKEVSSGPIKPAKGAVPAAQRGAIYTMLAREGVNAAELANAAMAKKTIGKSPVRRVTIAAPHGPSTSGGKHARQAITLASEQGEGGTVMCGYMDIGQKVVELRPYKNVSDQFCERFGGRLDFAAEEYKKLMGDLQVVLQTLQFQITFEAEGGARRAEADEPEEEGASDSAGIKAVVVVLAVVVLLLGGAAVLFR